MNWTRRTPNLSVLMPPASTTSVDPCASGSLRASASLGRRGFRGEIITTAASRELARLVMLDAAHLLEEDARHRARRGGHGAVDRDGSKPLYSILDALNCLDNFGRTATYSQVLEVAPGVERDLHRRRSHPRLGHHLPGAFGTGPFHQRAVFGWTSAIPAARFCAAPATPPRADNVVMETTYGDRRHKLLGPSSTNSLQPSPRPSSAAGKRHHSDFRPGARPGTAVFPESGRQPGAASGIDASVSRFADGDLGHRDLRRHPECFDPATAKLLQGGHDPFDLPGLHFTRGKAPKSIALNNIHGGAIIMAGSGLCPAAG